MAKGSGGGGRGGRGKVPLPSTLTWKRESGGYYTADLGAGREVHIDRYHPEGGSSYYLLSTQNIRTMTTQEYSAFDRIADAKASAQTLLQRGFFEDV